MPGSVIPLLPMLLVTAGSTLLYMSGMVMNDYFDQPIDRRERPQRPIVAGHISENAALMLGMSLLACAVILLSLASTTAIPWMLLLVSSVLAYNLLHRSALVGPLLMAACRALVPTIAAIACAPEQRPDWSLIAFFCLPLAAYTFALSIVAHHEARQEMQATASTRMAIAATIAALAAITPLGAIATRMLPAIDWVLTSAYVICICTAGATLLVGLRNMASLRTSDAATPINPAEASATQSVAHGVMRWIAAIAIIDTASLLLLGRADLAGIAAFAFLLTIQMQRRIMGS